MFYICGMEFFQLIKPSILLAPYIRYYWVLRIDAVGNQLVMERVLPVGCVSLTFHRGHRLFSKGTDGLQPTTFISGQGFSFDDVRSTGDIEMITVVFQPAAPRLFFNLPLTEFRERNVSPEEAGLKNLCELQKRITDAANFSLCISLIENFLLKQLRVLPEYGMKRMVATIDKVNADPEVNSLALSDTACLSKRQFNRVFSDYIGTTPKEFIRIIRMQRALFLLQQNPQEDFARLACSCGFYDQSHLIREFKLYSGYTPAEYLRQCDPYSDYFSTL